ncbi:RNA-binding protein Hfq [Clostridia bacterium]|nr:RNA-binding protein Hfq [Clostridia bacterium]
MARASGGYQDVFLNYARKERIPITMFLINGFQIKGTVRGFDSFTVVMESEGRQQMIYKHAISTIMPARQIPLELENE